jgi:cytosine/adenosine deaminase-related metal-dependent hydrolase
MVTIHRADWVLPITDEFGRTMAPIREGAVAVDGELIVAVGPASAVLAAFDAATPVREWAGVLMPGLVNAHTHLQYTSYGDMALTGLPFPQWISEIISRREHTTDDDWATSAAEGARELLRTGTTSAADDVTDDAAIAPVATVGLGGVSYLEMFGYDAATWSATGRELFNHRLDSAPTTREIGTMAHAIYTLDPEPFLDIIEIGRARGMRSQVHLAEATSETEFVASGTGPSAESARAAGWDFALVRDGGAGVSPTRFLADLGCLSPQVHAAHGVHCGSDDRALLRVNATTVALCPRSNRILQSGTPPIADYLREGSHIALGTDSLASSPSLDLLDEVRAAFDVARAQGYQSPDLGARLLHAATSGGARALGRYLPSDHPVKGGQPARPAPIGALFPGAQADMAVFGADLSITSPIDAVVLSGHCLTTIVRGEVVFSA